MKRLDIKTSKREEMVDITKEVARIIADTEGEGLVHLFVQHTTCGLTV
ncbi:YjbQ family protein, partial [Klebsiella pneumoniae]|nr:YjbQ family protein [Klebsiella pneumoniae]